MIFYANNISDAFALLQEAQNMQPNIKLVSKDKFTEFFRNPVKGGLISMVSEGRWLAILEYSPNVYCNSGLNLCIFHNKKKFVLKLVDYFDTNRILTLPNFSASSFSFALTFLETYYYDSDRAIMA